MHIYCKGHVMKLSLQQIQTIDECAKDDDSAQRLINLISDLDTKSTESVESKSSDSFPLDVKQLALLRMIIHALPVSAYVKDRHSRIVIANESTLTEHGVTAEADLIGKTDFDLIDNLWAREHFENEQHLMERRISLHDHETVFHNGDGLSVWNIITKAPIFDPVTDDVIGLIGINRNITKQRLAEKALEDERNILQTIIDNIQDKIYIKDRESRFISANMATLIAQNNNDGKAGRLNRF